MHDDETFVIQIAIDFYVRRYKLDVYVDITLYISVLNSSVTFGTPSTSFPDTK